METKRNKRPSEFSVVVRRKIPEGRVRVDIVEDKARGVRLEFLLGEHEDGSHEWRNVGFAYGTMYAAKVPDDEHDVPLPGEVTAEELDELFGRYPYWLSIARAAIETPQQNPEPIRASLSRRSLWKPKQPGRSPSFLADVADEYVWRFDAGQDAVKEMALAHKVTRGTVSKWLSKADDARVNERRAHRYRRAIRPS